MEPKVSIIIPVYNVEEYLDACLNSVINQTYKKLEIIVVNDGSTDNSGKKCELYKEQDSRITVYHKENGGLSDARNFGLEHCTGDYIFFLDSDDFLDINLIENLVRVAISDNADIIVNDAIDYYEGDPINNYKIKCKSECLNSVEAVKRTLMMNGIRHMAWGKLYRRYLWENRRFTTGILYEDLDVIYYVMFDARMISVINPSMYYYRQREGSIMNEKKVTDKNVSLFYTAERVCNAICQSHPILEKEAKRLEIVNDMKLLQSILDYDSSCFLDIQNKIQNKAREYCWSIFPILSYKDKVKILSLSLSKTVFHWVYSIKK